MPKNTKSTDKNEKAAIKRLNEAWNSDIQGQRKNLIDSAARIQTKVENISIKAKTKAKLLSILLDKELKPCKISTYSKDGRGRAQMQLRKIAGGGHYRPWHIAWMAAKNTSIPSGALTGKVEYSHRCHNENCVEPTHGIWESSRKNKSRWKCTKAAFVVLPNSTSIRLCKHSKCCLTVKHIQKETDPRFLGKLKFNLSSSSSSSDDSSEDSAVDN